jgi:hypothetical protein
MRVLDLPAVGRVDELVNMLEAYKRALEECRYRMLLDYETFGVIQSGEGEDLQAEVHGAAMAVERAILDIVNAAQKG